MILFLPRQKLVFDFVSCWLGNEIAGSRRRIQALSSRFKGFWFIDRSVLYFYELHIMAIVIQISYK